MTFTPIDDHAVLCETPEGKRLAFRTGLSPRRFTGADTVSLKKIDGVLTDANGKSFPWPVENLAEYQDEMLVIGPWPGENRAFEPENLGPDLMGRIIPAVDTLTASEENSGGLFTRALRLLDDGGVLLFPPRIVEFCRGAQSLESSAKTIEPWSHPDLKGVEAWSFSMGILAWRSLTGDDPYGDETGEERRERVRGGILSSLTYAAPGIDQDAAELITRALFPKDGRRPDLREWESLISRWRTSPLVRDLSPDERQEIENRAIKEKEAKSTALKRKRWFRRYGLIAGLATVGAIFAIGFLSAPLRKALSPPVTQGWAPEDVIQGYYNAMTAMDTAFMGDAVAKSQTTRGDIRQVDTIFVTRRVRQGYEGISDLPRADEWFAAGKPELPEGDWPWGVTDLQIRSLGEDRWQADYVLWQVDSEGASIGEERTDLITMEEKRRAWVIVEIRRSSGRFLDPFTEG